MVQFKTCSHRVDEINIGINVYRSVEDKVKGEGSDDEVKDEPSEGSTFFRDCLIECRVCCFISLYIYIY